MPSFEESYTEVIAALVEHFGTVEDVSSATDPFTRMVATLLGRSLEPGKVARALDALRDAGLLDATGLAETDAAEIVDVLNLARAKLPKSALRAMKRLARWIVDQHYGDSDLLADVPTTQLREELLSLNGIGAASADTMMLFALARPVFPVDRASYRILVRHGWLDSAAEYDDARYLIEQQAPDDPAALIQLSAWLERIGREACRTTVAHCERCPLKPYLPEGGPREPE
jgi:endonuclease III related protein